nr:MAG TPA: hypothetical protein [Caudoviricetes sp.]
MVQYFELALILPLIYLLVNAKFNYFNFYFFSIELLFIMCYIMCKGR